MKNKRQFRKRCQTACAAQLPGWHKRGSYGLYRRTEDFVQWLIFGVSDYDVLVIPGYGIQPLAVQFPAEAISLGGRIRDQRGAEYWIGADEWLAHENQLVEHILHQIKPPATDQLGIDNVLTFLDHFKDKDEFGMTAYGIAAIIGGDLSKGRTYLEKAVVVYERSVLEWSKANAIRLRSWLSSPSEELLHVLRRDAAQGARVLGLTEQ